MPSDGVQLIPREEVLTYEEIYTVTQAAAELGINKVRITGGEPLVRADLPRLVEMLAGIDSIDDIALTTNGILLKNSAAELKAAGLRRVNISLDTLKPERFTLITGGNNLSDVLEGIEAARSVGLNPVKLNMVVMSGINDDELLDFAARTINEEWHIRFIELMPFTGRDMASPQFVSVGEIRKRLESLGTLEPCLPGVGNGPAKYFRLPSARGSIGFISPLSEHFCFHCNRLRLTADGKLRPCLMADDEIDLKQPLRSGVSPEGLKKLIKEAANRKPLRHHLAEGDMPQGRPFSQVGG